MIFRREPALILAAIQAIIAAAVGFGLELSGEQTALLLAALAAIMGVVTRANVYAPATVEHLPIGPGHD